MISGYLSLLSLILLMALHPASKTAVMYSSNHAQLINTMFSFFGCIPSMRNMNNTSHLEMIIQDLGKSIEEYKAKLVIVDSIIAFHRAEFTGRGT